LGGLPPRPVSARSDGAVVELVLSDGGKGLLTALPLVYSKLAVQRFRVHKLRNVSYKARTRDRHSVEYNLGRISHAPTLPQARSAARRFRDM